MCIFLIIIWIYDTQLCADTRQEDEILLLTLSASSSSGLGSSGSSGTSSPNQRTSGGTSSNNTLHSLGSSTNFSLPISQSQHNIPANLIVAPKKRVPITDDPEGHLAYLPGDILMERYEIGKNCDQGISLRLKLTLKEFGRSWGLCSISFNFSF